MSLSKGWSDGKGRNEESPSDMQNCSLERCVQRVAFMKVRRDSDAL